MDHFQPAVDPRKQELLEARFLGARVNIFQFLYKARHADADTKTLCLISCIIFV